MAREDGYRDGGNGVDAWDPHASLRRIDPKEAHLSCGFLRCRPERWFPGFSGHWLPIQHSLGCEVRIVEAKPILTIPVGLETGFAGSVDGEPVLILFDQEAERIISDEIVPGGVPTAKEITLEYLSRRLLSTLALSWSGPESSAVRFERNMNTSTIASSGAIKLTLAINANNCTIWLALGRRLVERLDGLWRRQVQSSNRAAQGEVTVHLELVQLAIPPQMLSDYLKPNTVVDLEVRVSEIITLRFADRPWMSARLLDLNGKFGCEMLPQVPASAFPSEGVTRLTIELGSVSIDSQRLAELSQPGAVMATEIPLDNKVGLVVNGERVGNATLSTFEGRFAIQVV